MILQCRLNHVCHAAAGRLHPTPSRAPVVYTSYCAVIVAHHNFTQLSGMCILHTFQTSRPRRSHFEAYFTLPAGSELPSSYTRYEHLYSPRMVEEIKEEKNGTSNKQTVIWPNYLNYLNYSGSLYLSLTPKFKT